MSLSERYQDRRDQLLDCLELSNVEKRFIELCYRSNTAARRVALLIGQYVEAELRSEREGLLRLLIEDAVPTLRDAIAVASMSIPDGYVVLSNQQLDALRSVAATAVDVAGAGGIERAHAIERLKQKLEVVANLDMSIEVAI